MISVYFNYVYNIQVYMYTYMHIRTNIHRLAYKHPPPHTQ